MSPGSIADNAVTVLVVDDEEGLRHLLRLILERGGYRVVEAADGQAALAALQQDPGLRVVLCDIRMPKLDGLGFLDGLAKLSREGPTRVVMMSAYGNSDTAVACLSRGAFDYIAKPFRSTEVLACVGRIVERDQLEAENARLRAGVVAGASLGAFVGRSDGARQVMDLVRRAATYPSTVLITGESGTGKELLARALHDHSSRARGPYVPVNCAAIPEGLLESELFGHERGAYTGADRARPGLFEQADGGTLLLDEIGDMPVSLQTRLLRVLEDGKVRRVGGRTDKAVDVRVVAATARDLDDAVATGAFRADLYYRLNVVRVRVPPLRERREDIPLLAQTLTKRASQRLGRTVDGLTPRALAMLSKQAWRGNVRELENVLERAVIALPEGSTRLDADHLVVEAPSGVVRPVRSGASEPGLVVLGPDDGVESLSIKWHSARLERHLIELALARTGGHKGQAAKLLEISSKALSYKMRDYSVSE